MTLTATNLVQRTLARVGVRVGDDRTAGPEYEARRNLTTYKRLIWKRYQHAAHLEVLDRALEAVTRYVETGGREGTGRLIVMMPPRHGKTLTVSKLYPTWHLGRNPDHRVMMVSYGASLARKNSRYARATVRLPRYRAVFPGVTLAGDSAAAEAWDVAGREGGMEALGVGGAATGKGAHVLIIDDPIKNREEAESETIRDKIWDGYKDDLETRLEPGGAVIVMMTRWHQDDLIGRLLKQEPDGWTVIRLPALAEGDDDPLGRAPGEALWPERYPRLVLERLRDTRASYSWMALFQQAPIAAEGGLFKRANFGRLPGMPRAEDVVQAVRFWDLAMSSKDSADFTVGVLMAQMVNGRLAVLDVARQRMEWDDVPNFMAETALADGPAVPIGFEQKGYMSRAGQALVNDDRLHLYTVWGYPKDTDKVTNALPLASRVGLQVVDVVEAHWTADFLDELCSFPVGAHDDQVDASAGAYEMLGGEPGAGGINDAEGYEIGQGAY